MDGGGGEAHWATLCGKPLLLLLVNGYQAGAYISFVSTRGGSSGGADTSGVPPRGGDRRVFHVPGHYEYVSAALSKSRGEGRRGRVGGGV